MLPQEQQRIDELTREIESMRLQIKQLQDERESARNVQRNAVDPSVAVDDSQKVVANVNKWTCNPLFGVAVNYAITTGKRVMNKPIIPKSSTIKNKLTSLLHTVDAKLENCLQTHPSTKSIISPVKTCSTQTQTHEVLDTIEEKIQQPIPLSKSVKPNDTIQVRTQNPLKLEDALSYLTEIRLALSKKPEVYNQFLECMKDFKAGLLTTSDVDTKVKQLLDGHPELIIGFYKFLPPSHRINSQSLNAESLPKNPVSSQAIDNKATTPNPLIKSAESLLKSSASSQAIDNKATTTNPLIKAGKANDTISVRMKQNPLIAENALSYLDEIKLALSNKPQVFNEFLDCMKDFKAGFLTTSDVVKKVEQLLDGHPKLIIGFNQFLPPSHRINLQSISAESLPPKIHVETNSDQVTENEEGFVVIENNHISDTAPTTTEILVKTEISSQGQKNKSVDYSQVDSYVKKVKDRFQNEPEKLKRFGEILQTFEKVLKDKTSNDVEENDVTEKELTKQITVLFENNEDLTIDFHKYLLS